MQHAPRPPSGSPPPPATVSRRRVPKGSSGIPRLKASEVTAQRKQEEIASLVRNAVATEMQDMRESVLNLTAQLAAAKGSSSNEVGHSDQHGRHSPASIPSSSPTHHPPEPRHYKPKPPPAGSKKARGGRGGRVAKLKAQAEHHSHPRVHEEARDATPSVSPVVHASPSASTKIEPSLASTPVEYQSPVRSNTFSIDRDDTSPADVLEQLRLAKLRLNRKQRSIERELVIGTDMLRQSGQVFAANDLAREQARNHF